VRFQPGFRAPTGTFAASGDKLKDEQTGSFVRALIHVDARTHAQAH
jgi:hypothetical protein